MSTSRHAVQEQVRLLLEPHKGARQLDIFPEDSSVYQEVHLRSKTGALLVSYAGGRRVRGDERTPGRSFALDVVVLARRREGDAGALATLSVIEDALDGARFALDGVSYQVVYEADRFVDHEESVWHYVVRVSCTTL